MHRRLFLAGLLLILTGCTAVTAPPAVPNIYVMRHLHTPKGLSDPDLTAEGQAMAAAFPHWLAGNPPSVIFVSSTRRAQQTAAPTAQRYGVTPRIYDPSDTPGLVAAVLAQRGTVLVVGHSNTVPEIIAGLGGQRPDPLLHEDFGDIWHIQGAQRTTIRSKLPAR